VDAGILFMVNELCEDILRSIAHDEETKEFVWRYFEEMVALFQTTKLAPAMYRSRPDVKWSECLLLFVRIIVSEFQRKRFRFVNTLADLLDEKSFWNVISSGKDWL
jgi:hypothetical protein